MNDAPLWRGYWQMVASASAAAFIVQINLAMIATRGGRASGAYAILMRITLLEIAVSIASAAVAAIALGHAHRNGEAPEAIEKSCALALALGAATAIFGYFAYPVLLGALMGDAAAAPFLGAPIFWLVAGAPFRVLANTQCLLLHALGRGGAALAWRLAEIPAKAGANVIFMDVFEFGFTGCFLAGFVVTALSSIWLWSRLKPHGAVRLRIPETAFARFFLNGTFWEALRVLSPQGAMLFSLTLFSLPWPSGDGQRLDSYAAGQAFLLFILGPLITLTRFLAIRLPTKSPEQWMSALAPVIRVGASLALASAILLMLGRDWIGETFYGQHGDWWSVFVAALALSFPIRFVGGVVRGLALARRSFAKVAFADALGQWLVSPLLVLLGLWADRPEIAYQSLIWPEVVGVFLIWRNLRFASEEPVGVAMPSKGHVR
ncbi:MAG: methanobactin export MATE transporter MbnM [Methylocystis sp.]